MKISEAREIVGNMSMWNMYHMGLDVPRPADIKYSLEQMLMANKMVSNANKKGLKPHKNNGKTRRFKMQTTCAPRLIAAMFVAMEYEASNNSITCCNDKLIGVIKNRN